MPVYDTNAHFYDEQLRRYLLQFLRLFGGLHVQTGKGKDGTRQFRKVPTRLADMNRQVASIISNNSENTIKAAPFMVAYISAMQPDRSRTLNPTFQESVQIVEKEIDPTTNAYIDRPGKRTSVSRLMPAPYVLTCNIDVITTNTDNKFQILEQILSTFNPAIEVQSNTSPIDWTSLTVVELSDITYSSRGIPLGTDPAIDVATLVFTMPIWISPPVKVSRQVLINNIISDIHNMPDEDISGYYDYFGDIQHLSQHIYNPINNSIVVDSTHIKLTGQYTADNLTDTEIYDWTDLFKTYGSEIANGISRLILRRASDVEDSTSDVVVYINTTNEINKVTYTIDTGTLPANDYTVNATIDPTSTDPATLNNTVGDKYLILDNIHNRLATTWGVTANKNDIIQWNGSSWVVLFDSQSTSNIKYLRNSFSGRQFKWNGTDWLDTVQGTYGPGYWRVIT